MKKIVSVAPMMDCTDRHDRYFLRLISANVKLYTEMIVANAIIRGDKDFHLKFNLIEKPLALQIGGSNPKELAQACKIAASYGYDEINLNLGCPSRKVQKNKFGACLMKEPNLVGDCVNEMVNATNIPISIKTRIGFDNYENYEYLKKIMLDFKNKVRTNSAAKNSLFADTKKILASRTTGLSNVGRTTLKLAVILLGIAGVVFFVTGGQETHIANPPDLQVPIDFLTDRKSTRLNSSHW